jgi:hypothetical protein
MSDSNFELGLPISLHKTTSTATSSAHIIQSWFRRQLYKEWKSYTYSSTLSSSINTIDFFTFQPIHEIPFYRRFFLEENSIQQIYIFGFDLDSFYQLLHHSTEENQPYPCLNPYTRNPITEYQKYRFYRTVQLHKLLFPFFPYQIKTSMICLKLFEENHYLLRRHFPRSYDLRIKILMEELADLEPQWEVIQGIHWWKDITMDSYKSKNFYRILSVLLKKTTDPLFYFFRFPQRTNTVNNTLLCLELCEYFLLTIEATKEERESTATLILTALTVVSKDVRALFPWLYKNYW